MKYNQKAILMLWKIQHDSRNVQRRLPTDQSFAAQQSMSVESAYEVKRQYLELVSSGWSPDKGFPSEPLMALPAPAQIVKPASEDRQEQVEPEQVVETTEVEESAPKQAPDAPIKEAVEPVQDSKSEEAPSVSTGIKSPKSPDDDKKKNRDWFHVHSFLNVGTIQILFSVLAVLDVIRHFENYVMYFSRFQSAESSWISAILNAVPVVALPAAVVFAFQKKKIPLGVFLAVTFIPCVMFSVNVTNSNLEHSMSQKVAQENVAMSGSINGKAKIELLKAERAKLVSDVEELKAQSKMVTPKLSLPSTIDKDGKTVSNPEYYSAVRMINANDKSAKEKDARVSQIDAKLLELADTVDMTAEVKQYSNVYSVMNWAQAIFLDLLGVAAVFIAFFL